MFKKFFVLFNIFAVLVPTVIFADGMMIAPPSRYIFETDQKAVIFFEDGVETLIISTSFKGDTDDFGWIVPTPSRPEVEKASKEIFTALKELTEVQRDYPAAQGFGLDLMLEKGVNSVYVLEEKKIEYYDIAVLAADDKDALVDWLNENDYHFPKQYSYVLDSYIQNKWFFTAVKITKDVAVNNLQQDMWSGSLIPLQFKFLTNRPVYPLKISSVIEEPLTNFFKKSFKKTFIDGIKNKGFRLNLDESLNYNNSDKSPLFQNTVEMWLQPQNNFLKNIDSRTASGQLMSVSMLDKNKNEYSSKNSWNIRINNDGGIIFNHTMNRVVRNYITDEKITIPWTKDEWSHLAITWELGEYPVIYFNGKKIPWSDRRYANKLTGEEMAGSMRYFLGGEANTDTIKSDYFLRTFNFAIDELKISNIAKTQSEIKNSYNNKYVSLDENTVFLSNFDDNLKIKKNNQIKDEEFNYLVESKKRIILPKNKNIQKPSQIGIELYIFTPDKEQVLPGFQTRYAAWTDKKVIEDLAFNDNGEPWIKVKEDRYYLTKLGRYMKYSEMDSDLFFRDAEKNSDVIIDTQKSKIFFYVIITLSILFLFILFPILIYQFYKKD